MAANNRPKISFFIATSIDGFIANESGDIDWLTNFPLPTADNEEKDCGFQKFFSKIDTLIMGRHTYETVAKFNTWPYAGKRVIVLSSTLQTIHHKAELFTGDISFLVEKLHSEGIKHIYVDGGKTISQFLQAKMIDHMIISIIPVVLGKGISLFSNIHNDRWCRLISSKVYSNGLVQLKYDINNS